MGCVNKNKENYNDNTQTDYNIQKIYNYMKSQDNQYEDDSDYYFQ